MTGPLNHLSLALGRLTLVTLLSVLAACANTPNGGDASADAANNAARAPVPAPRPATTVSKAVPERDYAKEAYKFSTPANKKRPYKSSTDDSLLSAYKHAVAEAIEAANPGYVHPGRPQEPLRAVVVYEIAVSPEGDATLRLIRASKDEDMQRRARATVRNAEPLPKPPGGKAVKYTETWLFDHPGKFRLRTSIE